MFISSVKMRLYLWKDEDNLWGIITLFDNHQGRSQKFFLRGKNIATTKKNPKNNLLYTHIKRMSVT